MKTLKARLAESQENMPAHNAALRARLEAKTVEQLIAEINQRLVNFVKQPSNAHLLDGVRESRLETGAKQVRINYNVGDISASCLEWR